MQTSVAEPGEAWWLLQAAISHNTPALNASMRHLDSTLHCCSTSISSFVYDILYISLHHTIVQSVLSIVYQQVIDGMQYVFKIAITGLMLSHLSVC